MSSKDVAEGYGLSDSGLRSVKSKYSDELLEGTHFIYSVSNRDGVHFINVTNSDIGGRPSVYWTKESKHWIVSKSNAQNMTGNSEELEEGKHYLTIADCNAENLKVTMWTKKGVIGLGFLIKTPLAKQLRKCIETI